MGLLEGKNAVVFGVANKYSIAWAIAQAFHREGANVGISYAGPVMEKRVRPLAEKLGLEFVEPCDVTQDDQIEAIAQKAKEHFGRVDILVHSIAYAERDDLMNPFYQTSRKGFHTAMDISVYSFIALARAFQPLMTEGGAMVTLTYYGGEKVAPGYNVMGVAKAALEASMRYLAYNFGPMGIRVNAISAGPIKTLAASGVPGFRTMHKTFPYLAPLKQPVSQEDVANAAVFLCSDLSAKVTGHVLFVDCGVNIMAFPDLEALKALQEEA